MSLKEQVTSQLNQLSEPELAKVSQYIAQIKKQLPPRRVKNNAYLKVREALTGVQDMSQLIIDERADRL